MNLGKVTLGAGFHSPHERLGRNSLALRTSPENQPLSGGVSGISAAGVASRCAKNAFSVVRKVSECIVSRLLCVAPSTHAGSSG